MRKFLWLTLPPLVYSNAHTRVVRQAMEDTKTAKEPDKKEKEVGKLATDSSAAETARQDNADKKEVGKHVTDDSVDSGTGLLDVQGIFGDDYTVDARSDKVEVDFRLPWSAEMKMFHVTGFENTDMQENAATVKKLVNKCSTEKMKGIIGEWQTIILKDLEIRVKDKCGPYRVWQQGEGKFVFSFYKTFSDDALTVTGVPNDNPGELSGHYKLVELVNKCTVQQMVKVLSKVKSNSECVYTALEAAVNEICTPGT